MEEKEIIKKIYVANDGKEFFLKEDCEKYEVLLNDIISNIKYFRIEFNPDLTETGCYRSRIFVAVYSSRFHHYEIAFEWALRKHGGYLGTSVQGYGIQPKFVLFDSNKKEFEESGEIFLSPKTIKGFPENFDYMKEWGFK